MASSGSGRPVTQSVPHHLAFLTARRTGVADIPPELNESHGDPRPSLGGIQRPKVLFNFDRIGLRGQADPAGHPPDMGVHRDGGDSERLSQHHTGRFSPHAPQGDQLIEVGRDHSSEAFGEITGKLHNRPGFLAVETSGKHRLFHLFQIRFAQIGRGGPSSKQVRRHSVDIVVGGLSRQDGGNQQFPGVAIVQCGASRRIATNQPVEHCPRLSPLGGGGRATVRQELGCHSNTMLPAAAAGALSIGRMPAASSPSVTDEISSRPRPRDHRPSTALLRRGVLRLWTGQSTRAEDGSVSFRRWARHRPIRPPD